MRTIVWDIDDVLNSLMRAWLADEWLPSHPECRASYADLQENPPERSLGIGRAEYLASLDRFRVSNSARNLEPNPAILDWLRCHGGSFRHVALTARPMESAPQAAEWVLRHFGVWIRCFAYVPSRLQAGLPQYDRSKAEFLEAFGRVHYMVDDCAENIAAAERAGIRGILYPQPWNRAGHRVEDVLAMLTEAVVLS